MKNPRVSALLALLALEFISCTLLTSAAFVQVVVFTASLAKYADPLLDLLDSQSVVRARLFRDSCCPYEGNYVKDLSVLGRDLHSVIIIDNSPHSYVFHPENAVPISTFIDDPNDQELIELIPYLNAIAEVDDVRLVLAHFHNDR
ncbi:hypothetical protein CBR_g46276 [Chara braunii]|uniref:FCP1 homology domain-containing protein n=1 Tax=Chara braunii TaxID=69332 RepID=A0A388K3U7_CHABU|nr:hypothetical protein CBR_g46276 [Chara braunii]|eukprot:GBG64730.1 hypothetical protein CBR_g46276 [Chara braunii]